MGDKSKIFLVFFLAVFLSSFASATFIVGNQSYSINTIYGPSGNVTGWLNISFSNEPLGSSFNDSNGNGINLSNILQQNQNYVYTCTPSDCGNDYTPGNAAPTKQFSLNTGQTTIYGLKLTGNVVNINYLNFTLTSDAAPSCTNQVGIDFLADSSIDAINTNAQNSLNCPSIKTYGCYDNTLPTNEQKIGITPYCEELNLTTSPGFFLGAWIQKFSGSENITASLYNPLGQRVGICTLPDSSTNGGEVSCSVNYSISQPEQDYVCINVANGTGDYRTNGYYSSNGCGFFGTPIPSSTPAAYEIFAEGKEFDAVGTVNVNGSLNSNENLAQLATDYIGQRYNMNCTLGCIIPIEIDSNANQNLNLGNLQFEYTTDIGIIPDSNFYDLSVIPAKVRSSFQQLYLNNAGFSVPNSLENYSFSLFLDENKVISQMVQVENVPIINVLTPSITASAFPTIFNVSVSSTDNVTNFLWDFGDNSSTEGPGNSTTHTYDATGLYNLTVTAIDRYGLNSSKVFVVNVTSPANVINSDLTTIQNSITRLQGEISSYSSFDQQVLNSAINLTEAQQTLNFLKGSYQNASSDSDYNAVVSGLLGMKIPDDILETGEASSLPFITSSNSVNLDTLQSIAGGNYTSGEEQDYSNAVSQWQQTNVDAYFGFAQFSGIYQGDTEPLISTFNFTFSEKQDIPYDYYLIFPQMDGFQSNINFSTNSGYSYLDLKNNPSVSFSTTDSIDPTNIPAFISPSLTQISVVQTTPEGFVLSKWVTFAMIIIGIIVIAIIIYMILRKWYAKRYENFLFKNKNDLYNMVNYVNNAKKKGMKNQEIEENLKKVGWSGERIRYVMRKYAGKRTGLV